MRDRSSWYQPVIEALRPWPAEHADTKPTLLCQVELGLRLLELLDPSLPADSVWPLLGGYPFGAAAGLVPDELSRQRIVNARHLLWTLRRHRMWTQSLDSYARLPERLRGYRLLDGSNPARRVDPPVAAHRFTVYDAALGELPALERKALPLAGAGPSILVDRRRRTQVVLPDELVLPPAPGHALDEHRPATGKPLRIPLTQLAETARWMDAAESELDLARRGNWEGRLADLRLDTRSADGLRFEEADELTLAGLCHLVGMVGAGKSTLMSLIAVWGARRGLRTTLVVGDVAEQLNLVALFRALDLPVAPVLGTTTRERHVQRLHRRLAGRGTHALLLHEDPGFDDLSTVCVIDALRGLEAIEPLRYADAPCTSLYPVKTAGQDANTDQAEAPGRYRATVTPPSINGPEELGRTQGCPVWSRCPRHSAAREQVDALIWVANPASLVQTAVPRHLGAERLRQLELACLRSDIVIVDEVDRVQMNLDDAFAPSATLVVSGPESWLDRLHTHKIEELALQGRLPLTDRDVEHWSGALDVVSSATNRLYSMLINDADLRDWAEINYFSAWTLQEKLLEEWYPSATPAQGGDGQELVRDESDLYELDELDLALLQDDPSLSPPGTAKTAWAARREAVTEDLDSFRDDPLGDHSPHRPLTEQLIRAGRDLLHTQNAANTRRRVRTLLTEVLDGAPGLAPGEVETWPAPRTDRELIPADFRGTEDWYERNAKRLEFTLLLAVLHQRLSRLTFLWPQVEAAIHLDGTDNELSRRPPLDYAPVIPEAPMGNVLGFQFLPDEPGRDQDLEGRRSGTLRFFRCAGVGRELLHALPELGADPAAGRPGPHVLLMSGTSWAGSSTRAHVLAPVQAVLKPRSSALTAIRGTVFQTQFVYDRNNRPITLSGQDPKIRLDVLRQLVGKLARPGRSGRPSMLEAELAQISDDRRRRALLLVGSYREATAAADLLEELPRWRGRVRVLTRDDADLEEATGPDQPRPEGRAVALRRGDISSFAQDEDAELLVAPLLAVERGHNILSTVRGPNEERVAAFGTVLFLVRPHPRPDDLSLSVLAINDWVSRFTRDQLPHTEFGTFSDLVAKSDSLSAAGLAFRRIARTEWRRLLTRRYIYSRLSEDEQKSFAWDQLVTIWQVIGRLVRGGVPARVVFVDAAFAPALAQRLAPTGPSDEFEGLHDDPTGSRRVRRTADEGLLARLRDVLAPYFDPEADPAGFVEPSDPALVRLLYQPLYDALCGLNTQRNRNNPT
jgi:pPIWI RE three-gene island domain Z